MIKCSQELSSKLGNHLRKDLQCEFCGKGFSKASALGGHLGRVHPKSKQQRILESSE